MNETPLISNIDNLILKHREAHFAGQFPIMIEYYKSEGKGCRQELPLERIEELAKIEEEAGENLAALYLTGADAEEIALSQKAYKELRNLYQET